MRDVLFISSFISTSTSGVILQGMLLLNLIFRLECLFSDGSGIWFSI